MFPSSNTSTVEFASAVPEISVIVVLRKPACGSVMTGASGAVRSTTTTTASEAGPVLPASSVAVAVRL